MTKAQLLAVGSTAELESGGCSSAVCLTDEQRRQIRQAAHSAYDKLRWYLGDSREMMSELQLLARDSFLEGMRQERSNVDLWTPPILQDDLADVPNEPSCNNLSGLLSSPSAAALMNFVPRTPH